jgi:hypothetical protein
MLRNDLFIRLTMLLKYKFGDIIQNGILLSIAFEEIVMCENRETI